MPENIKAVNFWRRNITHITNGNYIEVFKTEKELRTFKHPDPYAMQIFTFVSKTYKIIQIPFN